MNFESEIQKIDSIEDLLQNAESVTLNRSDYYTDFDRYSNATVEIGVEPLNVRQDFPKYITLHLSDQPSYVKLKEQIQVYVLGENSDKILFALYENINFKYSLLTSVFEDIFFMLEDKDQDERCDECGRPYSKKKPFLKKLKSFISQLSTDPNKKDIYYKMFKDIYQHRNLFTHALHRETREQQIQTLLDRIPKFGYTLSDHNDASVGRLGGEEIFSNLIKQYLVSELKRVKAFEPSYAG